MLYHGRPTSIGFTGLLLRKTVTNHGADLAIEYYVLELW